MASQTRLSTLLSRDAAGMEEAHLLLLRVSLYNLLGGQRNNFLETQREDVGTVMHQHIKSLTAFVSLTLVHLARLG